MLATTAAVFSLPISYADARAYLALLEVPLELWEIEVLFDIDDKIVPMLNKNRGKGGKGKEGIAALDTSGVKAMMSGLAKRPRKDNK